jgi:hypothetical protein
VSDVHLASLRALIARIDRSPLPFGDESTFDEITKAQLSYRSARLLKYPASDVHEADFVESPYHGGSETLRDDAYALESAFWLHCLNHVSYLIVVQISSSRT